jgi:hypothetical protein
MPDIGLRINALTNAVERLLRSINDDGNGGGLLSRRTLRYADEARVALSRLEMRPEPCPHCGRLSPEPCASHEVADRCPWGLMAQSQ